MLRSATPSLLEQLPQLAVAQRIGEHRPYVLGTPQRPLQTSLVALLLVGNLVPAMGLLVLLARRIARAKAERSPLGGRS